MAFEATKREWCELLTFFRLLADGKVALGTADVKKGDVYWPIAMILGILYEKLKATDLLKICGSNILLISIIDVL